jgi:hypothetical protein
MRERGSRLRAQPPRAASADSLGGQLGWKRFPKWGEML